jgi:serine/threonine protein kinase/serine/threonine protein phosphatase PrpC
MPKNYYELLNVSPGATLKEISKAYKKIMLANHPDKVFDPEEKSRLTEKVQEISGAYSALMQSHNHNDSKLSVEKNLYDLLAEKKESKIRESSENNQQSNAVFFESFIPRLSRGADRELYGPFLRAFKERLNLSDQDDYIRLYSNKKIQSSAAKTATFRIQGDRDTQEDYGAVSYDIIQLFKTFGEDWQRYLLTTLIKQIQIKYFSEFYKTGAAVDLAFTWRTINEKGQEVVHVVTAHVGDVLPIAIIVGKTYETTQVKRLAKPHNLTQGKRHYVRVNNYGINMTRSMGDVYLQKAKQITCEPDISFQSFILEPGDTFQLMIACDGFTDYVNEEEMRKIAWQFRNQPISKQIKAYGDFAFAYKGSSDNISIILTSEELALLDCDGHGGEKVAQIMTKICFNELKQKMLDILALSTDFRKKLMEDFKEKENKVSVKEEQRTKKIAELCDFKIAEHTVAYENLEYFPKAECLIITSNLNHSMLLDDIEEYLVDTGLSYSPQEEYYAKGYNFKTHGSESPKQLRLVIPIGKIEQLPDIFDIFLMYLENSLKNYNFVNEEIVTDTPLASTTVKEIKSSKTEDAISKTVDSLDTPGADYWDSRQIKSVEFIPGEKLQIKTFKKIMVPVENRLTSRSSVSALTASSLLPAITYTEKKDEVVSVLVEKKINSTTEDKVTTEDKKITLVERKVAAYNSYISAVESRALRLVHKISKDIIQASGMSGGASGSQTIMGKMSTSSGNEDSVTIKFSSQVGKSKMNIAVMDFLAKQTPPSPYIVKLRGLGYSDYIEAMIVMDNAELGTLDRFLDAFYKPETERLSYPILLKIAHDIAQGLAYLHKLGIVHNDLRTEQIYLAKDLTAKIGGFSYSFDHKDNSETGDNATLVQGSEGTDEAKYPPEGSSLKIKYSQRDVYAFGLILRELFDRPPHHKAFAGVFEDIYTVKRQGRKEFIPPNCPPPIQQIMKKCWEMHPQNRYTAEELATVFRELLAAMPTMTNDFKITFPAEYNVRVMGEHKKYVNEELKEASSQDKLLDLLFTTSLLTPQNDVFVLETPHVDRLWQEYQALVMAGLDNEENFAVIKKYLPENLDQQLPLTAKIIALLDACSLRGATTDADCCHMLLQSRNRLNIYNILIYLLEKAESLCTYENFVSLIYLENGSNDILDKLKKASELNQTVFNTILSGETIPALLLEEKEIGTELTSVPMDVIPAITYISSSTIPSSTNENLTAEKPDNVSENSPVSQSPFLLFKPGSKNSIEPEQEQEPEQEPEQEQEPEKCFFNTPL